MLFPLLASKPGSGKYLSEGITVDVLHIYSTAP
jgi:hypothetical protein